MRSRFEEYYVKSGRGGRKLDDVRDKYQRACRRLHLVHNEYVLLLAEAEQMQRDLRSCLLPTLLHQHQATLQAFILNWRSILKEVAIHWNFTSRQFRDVFTRSEAHVDTIEPSDEYSDFLQRQTYVIWTSPPELVDFSFDNSLVEDTSGKLLANTLAVDNLTVEWVRGKLSETEPKLKECQEKLSNKNAHLQKMSEVELAELQCEEKKLAKQLEVIKKALTELGCEEVPSGCDIPIETNYDHNQDNQVWY
ncbi:hypothetical protein AAG570_010397 [Ranatra chinensis]|uniref:F-BAR domain-containing protein n=1 Tax=Ranatra chinensis TaxID=642074 RepID=A0ABD0Z0K7_9HEMI